MGEGGLAVKEGERGKIKKTLKQQSFDKSLPERVLLGKNPHILYSKN